MSTSSVAPQGAVGLQAPGWLTRLRPASGLLLFTFVAMHLANHALGLVSLEAMEAGRHWLLHP